MSSEWWTDYQVEAEPAFNALRAGHMLLFLQHCPAYGGSLVIRAPFVLASGMFHGGSLSAFRAAALPCLLAAVAFGVVLFRDIPSRGGAYLALGLAAVNPISARALGIGHPEELLGGVLCAGAVLCALEDRETWAGLLLGLAIANKAWAAMAVGPVLIALGGWRWRTVLAAGAVVAVVISPLALAGRGSLQGTADATGAAGTIFHPWQAWWFLGSRAHDVTALGAPVGYRLGAPWISAVSHPLIAVLFLPLSVSFWRIRHDRVDALGLLALLLFLRCLLDPWNISYYHLPFVMAFLAWEVRRRHAAPVMAGAITLAVWLTFRSATRVLSPDMQAVSYLVWALPLTAGLAIRLYAPQRFAAIAESGLTAARRRMPTLLPSPST